MPNDPKKEEVLRKMKDEMLRLDSDFEESQRQNAAKIITRTKAELAEKNRLIKKMEQSKLFVEPKNKIPLDDE